MSLVGRDSNSASVSNAFAAPTPALRPDLRAPTASDTQSQAEPPKVINETAAPQKPSFVPLPFRLGASLFRQFVPSAQRSDEVYTPITGGPGEKAFLAVTNTATECRLQNDAKCVEKLYWGLAVAAAPVRPMSSRFLRHYLDGSGKPLAPRTRTLAKMPGIKAFQQHARKNLAEQFRNEKLGAAAKGKFTEPTIDFDHDMKEYLRAYGGRDMYTASGHFDLIASYDGEVVQRGGKRVLSVDVTWKFCDIYDWAGDQFDVQNMEYLRRAGRAKVFDMSTQWTTHEEIPL